VGDWEPIIAPDKWLGLAVLNDPARRTRGCRGRKYLLPGVARCGVCGGKQYATPYPHGRNRGMVCTCPPQGARWMAGSAAGGLRGRHGVGVV
jgi:hypothetical protein